MTSKISTLSETLNERLRRRREELGASVDKAASWAGLDPERLEEIEGGAPLQSSELDAVCRGLAVDSGALARGGDRSPRRSVARFKAAAWVDPEPEDFRTLSLAAELGRIGGFLSERTGNPSRLADLRAPEPVSGTSEPWRQGYLLGENARRVLEPRTGPIVDLEALLRSWRVHVARVELSSPHLDAASLWERGSLPVILLNTRSSRLRSSLSRRALLAHELCHLLHDSGDRDLTTQLSWSEHAGNYEDEVEQRARAFAPAFLAPRDEVRSWFRAGAGKRIHDPERKVEALARHWGFSLRGAVWHAKNCGIIQARTAEALSRSVPEGEHSWADEFEVAEPDSEGPALETFGDGISPFARGLLADLAAEAATAGVISAGRGREIVTWA